MSGRVYFRENSTDLNCADAPAELSFVVLWHASKSRTLVIRLWIKYSCFASKSEPRHSTNAINNSRQKEDKPIYYLPACNVFNIELSGLAAHWHSSNTVWRWEAESVCVFYRLLCSISYQTFCWLSLLFVAQVCRSWNLWRISIFGKLLIYQVIKNVQAILLVYLNWIFIFKKQQWIKMILEKGCVTSPALHWHAFNRNARAEPSLSTPTPTPSTPPFPSQPRRPSRFHARCHCLHRLPAPPPPDHTPPRSQPPPTIPRSISAPHHPPGSLHSFWSTDQTELVVVAPKLLPRKVGDPPAPLAVDGCSIRLASELPTWASSLTICGGRPGVSSSSSCECK